MDFIILIGWIIFGVVLLSFIGNSSQKKLPVGFGNISTFAEKHNLTLRLGPPEDFSLTSFNRLITVEYWGKYPYIPIYVINKYYDILGIDGIFLGLSLTPDGLPRNCHQQAHNAGKVVFLRSEDKIAGLQKCSKYCQGVR